MNIPERVRDSFEKLKIEYGGNIHLRRARKNFLVYEKVSRYALEIDSYVTSYRYVCRITDEGLVVPSRVRHFTKKDFERLKSIEEAHDELEKTRQLEMEEAEALPADKYETKLIEKLSEDGRSSLKEIGNALHLRTTAADYQLKKLEAKYGVKYVVELNIDKLGYQKFMCFVKFREIPETKIVREALESIPEIQLVSWITGEYNLLVYFYAESNKAVTYLIHHIRTKTQMKEYISEWYTAPFFDSYGFVQTRKEFFSLLSNRIWKRTRESPRPALNQITYREYSVMDMLAKDASVPFVDIDMEKGFEKGASRYTYAKLKEKGYIKRVTITLEKLPIKYNSMIFMRVLNGLEVDESRKNLLLYITSNAPLLNRFSLVGDIEMPHSVLFIMPSFTEHDPEDAESYMKSNIKGIETQRFYMTETIIGEMVYRRIHLKHTHQYKVLEEEYKFND